MPTAPRPALTLAAIADAIDASPLPHRELPHMYVERLGGGVYGLVTFGGLTLTLNGGQQSVDVTDEGPADVLICRDGAEIALAEAVTADEVALLLATVA